MQPTQGTSLEHLALVAEKNCVSGPHEAKTFSKTALHRQSFPHPTPQVTAEIVHTPSSPVQMGYLSWSFGLRGRLQVYHIPDDKEVLSQQQARESQHVLSLRLAAARQHLPEWSHTLVWSSDFLKLLPKRTPPDHGSSSQKGLHCGPQNCVCLQFVKALLENLDSGQPATKCRLRSLSREH